MDGPAHMDLARPTLQFAEPIGWLRQEPERRLLIQKNFRLHVETRLSHSELDSCLSV